MKTPSTPLNYYLRPGRHAVEPLIKMQPVYNLNNFRLTNLQSGLFCKLDIIVGLDGGFGTVTLVFFCVMRRRRAAIQPAPEPCRQLATIILHLRKLLKEPASCLK